MGTYILVTVILSVIASRAFLPGHMCSAALVLSMGCGVVLIRRGLFRAGAAVVVGAWTASVGLNLFALGLSANREHLKWFVVPLAMAALLLGARAVLFGLAGVVLLLVAAAARDAGYLGGAGPQPIPEPWLGSAGAALIFFVLLAILLERLGSEMRRALAMALGREAELRHAFDELRGAHAALEKETGQRKQAEEALIRSQKLEALGRLSSGVAHDFNNLLTVIFASVASIEEQLPAGGQARDDAAEIRRASARAATLTRQLLAFARKQVTEPRAARLDQVVGELAPMLRRLLGEDVRIELRHEEDPWQAWVDPAQLDQVVMNLVVNARDAMPSGGRILIRTRNEQLAAEEAAAVGVAPGEYACIDVEDTGSGMDRATLDRAFEPFFTTKEMGRGTGLGLSTCYGIISQAGGGIGVTTAPGRGTTMRVYLPRVAAMAPALEEHRARVGARATGEYLLLVEDEPVVRALAAEALRRKGYRILEAGSAEQALEVLASHRGGIHLLVTDVVLPGEDGKRLAQRLASERPGLPVLYVSGYPESLIAERGLQGGRVDLLLKPFEPEDLARRVRAALDVGAARAQVVAHGGHGQLPN